MLSFPLVASLVYFQTLRFAYASIGRTWAELRDGSSGESDLDEAAGNGSDTGDDSGGSAVSPDG